MLLRSELLKKGQTLQDFAYATEGRNRYIGSQGHNSTVNWLIDTLSATGYYDIEKQSFTVPDASASLSVNNVTYEAAPMTFTAAGAPTGSLVAVANIGCDAVSLRLTSFVE